MDILSACYCLYPHFSALRWWQCKLCNPPSCVLPSVSKSLIYSTWQLCCLRRLMAGLDSSWPRMRKLASGRMHGLDKCWSFHCRQHGPVGTKIIGQTSVAGMNKLSSYKGRTVCYLRCITSQQHRIFLPNAEFCVTQRLACFFRCKVNERFCLIRCVMPSDSSV